MKIDIDFIEFYIKKKYNQKLEEYFDVNKSVSSKWRNSNFPKRRMSEFIWREGTQDLIELLERIYLPNKSN
jgi:dissimilatory sulfite reductase (desulfoviridin) alpha/beta subunit